MLVIWSDALTRGVGVGTSREHIELPARVRPGRPAALVFPRGDDIDDVPGLDRSRRIASVTAPYLEVATIGEACGARTWDALLSTGGRYDVYDVSGIACIVPAGGYEGAEEI